MNFKSVPPPTPNMKVSPDSVPITENLSEIVKLLLQEGLLTEDQLAYARRVHAKLSTPKPLLDVLKELKYVADPTIRATIREKLQPIYLGDLLIELGLITRNDLELGLELQSQEHPKRKLGEVLIDHNFIDERNLIETLSLQLGYPLIDPEFAEIDADLFQRGVVQSYQQHSYVPITREDDHLVVAFADPMDNRVIAEAQNVFLEPIKPAIASQKSILAAIKRVCPDTSVEQIKTEPGQSVVRIINQMITEAITLTRVSDIHIEPLNDRLRVRFRLDGVLEHYKDYPLAIAPAVSSTIKVMCKADIAERRRHQGGRILFETERHQMDLRVSFYVTVAGEKIVLRLLNRQTELLNIEDVGMTRRVLQRFRNDALDLPSGVILVTGPTGSGKTTTVYACINHLNNFETSIITAEDPVEYVIDGVAQCSIDPKINLTFDETLRHVVRQDPDVIVIGEIRDFYSAEVAVQAALTGHKVLTTFHTEDSIGGLLRLLNMDIDAFLISSTVVCVVAQRLLRKVCPECVADYTPTPSEILRIGCSPTDLEGARFKKSRGCPACRHTGYNGRIAVFEVLVLNEPVRDALIKRQTSHQIRKVSIETTGLVTLFEDGLHRAAIGKTSIDEVLRCLPRLQKPRPIAELYSMLGDE